MSKDRIVELERKIGALTAELADLRRASPGTPVPDYTFRTQFGEGRLHHLMCEQFFFVVSGAIKVVHQEHSR